MTFVGKILVIIILVFALFFLALSTVVFTTSTNWKDKSKAQGETITKVQNELKAAQGNAKSAEDALKRANDDFTAKTAVLNQQIASLNQANDKVTKEITENRTLLETAQNSARESLAVGKARTEEADELRKIVRSTQDQANQFKEQQRDLRDKIRILERELAVAKANNTDLRERVSRFVNLLRDKHISPDTPVSGTAPPPPVEGKVLKVDSKNRRVEISIGSDDGLAVGHVLSVYRTSPSPAYIGRIVIEAVDPDQAVGTVQGTTIRGQKIQEGDNVSSEIRPRT